MLIPLYLRIFCQELGWQGEGTNYDVLPLVFSIDGKAPIYKEIPRVKKCQLNTQNTLFHHLE